MKKLTLIDKLLFILNSFLAVILLFSYILPYISPKIYAIFSVISLGTPLLIILNFLFIIYWLIKLKKQFILSLLVLILGFQYLHSFVQLSEKKVLLNDDLKIMSYNVRLFNAYKWSKKDSLPHKIRQFIKDKEPDVLAIQEFYRVKKQKLKFPYSYADKKRVGSSSKMAIFSKYKIINYGSFEFKKSGNNAIFVDILKNKDTLRIYNIHLQSLRIDKNKDNFGEKDSEKLIARFKQTFLQQAEQVELILAHQKKCTHKKIILGDFNNTAFSWVYKQLKGEKNDAFIEAGSGLGKSFDYFFPFRIDFILADKNIEIHNFKTYNVKYSDHYPIMARINFSK